MKSIIVSSLLLTFASLVQANPEIAAIIDQEYGAASAEGIVLLQSTASPADPTQWMVYVRDPFRVGELNRVLITANKSGWTPKADAAGSKLLSRVPPQTIAFNRIKFSSADARKVAQQNAALSKTNFVTVAYQLAANATTGAPEWGLALNDPSGNEVGFIVVSAETGVVIHHQWTHGTQGGTYSDAPSAGFKGEKAAEDVKRAARKAWEWTGDTGLEVGHFFKRLFRND